MVGGHTTSVTLEDAFWVGLREIAIDRGVSLSDLVGDIDTRRTNSNLSSTLRLFVFDHFCHRTGAPSPSRIATQAADGNPIRAKSVA